MIKSFADAETKRFFETGESKKLPPDILRRALRKLELVDNAVTINDLRLPPSNRLHALSGDRKGQHSISINTQWRICFELKTDGAYSVEICDYH